MTLARLPRAGAISKPHDYKQKVQKWRVFWKNEIQRGNSLKISNEKKTKKNPVIVWRTEQKNHETPKAKTEHETCSHEEINWSKIEKSIQNKTARTCMTRTKKSNPDLLTFYVISGGHDMANDAGPTTTCRRNFKAPWLQTEGTKMKGLLKKWNSTRKQFENFKRKKNQKKSSHRMENRTKEPRDPEGKNWTWTM